MIFIKKINDISFEFFGDLKNIYNPLEILKKNMKIFKNFFQSKNLNFPFKKKIKINIHKNYYELIYLKNKKKFIKSFHITLKVLKK